MKTKTSVVRLGDIAPNPHRKLEAFPFDPDKIEALRKSIRDTEFWPEMTLAQTDSGDHYLFGGGHHRLEAAKQELGEDYKAKFQVATEQPKRGQARRRMIY